jgi:hypothetical protein
MERQTRASIQYTITILISQSKLRSDSQYAFFSLYKMYGNLMIVNYGRINTPFAYVPHVVPEPLSLLCQVAYQEDSLLPSPESDPQGWMTSDVVTVRGVLNTTRYVVAKCKVSKSVLPIMCTN